MQQISVKTYRPYIAIFIFLVLVVVAMYAEWQYDEAWTYTSILGLSPSEIASYDKYNIANNHVINSLYFNIIQNLGVRFVFIYRLLSLATYWLYLYFINKLLNDDDKTPLIGYAALYLMPFMIYFTLGRGYSMAISCFAASIFYYKQFLKGDSSKSLLLFVVTGSVCSLSLFSFSIPFIAMLVWLAIISYKTFYNKPKYIGILAIALPVLLYVNKMGHVINLSDPHIVGGDSFIKNGTLSSIITYMCLYDYLPYKIFLIVKIGYLGSLGVLVIGFIKSRQWKPEFSIIIASFVVMVVLHYTMGAKYPYYRSVSYIPLLFTIALVVLSKQKNIFFSQHLYVVAAIGLLNLFVITRQSLAPNTYDALKYVSEHGNRLLVSDNENPNITVYNKLYFNDTLRITRIENFDQDKLFYTLIDSSTIILCENNKLESMGKSAGFYKQYVFPFNALYVRKK